MDRSSHKDGRHCTHKAWRKELLDAYVDREVPMRSELESKLGPLYLPCNSSTNQPGGFVSTFGVRDPQSRRLLRRKRLHSF